MKQRLTRMLPWLALVICLPVVMVLATNALEGRMGKESLTLAEQSVRRAAVQCYALEGAYPTEVSYLEANYGVAVDPERYRVDYIYIGSNLMPDITIIPLGGA